MTLVITHPYVSSVTETTPSGGPGGNVGPSEWNANHTLTGLVSPAQGGTGITSGTGVTFFSSATVIADSGTLTANALLLGGGANVAPSFVGSLGTTSTLLHGNASGAPSFGAVNLGSEVAGTLSTANLTNATTAAFGIIKPDNSTITISSGVISSVGGSLSGSGAANQVTFWSSANVITGDGSFTYTGAGTGVTIKLSSSTSTGLAGLSIATSSSSQMQSDAAALKITATWNSSSVTYDAPLFMNVVPTLNAAGSRLIDAQLGSTTLLTLASTGLFALANGISPAAINVFNTVDNPTNPTNFERAVFDWVTNANVLTIGTQNGGSGSPRGLHIQLGNQTLTVGSSVGFLALSNNTGTATLNNSGILAFSSSASFSAGQIAGGIDSGISRIVSAVMGFGNGSAANTSGWLNWGGQNRVTANVTSTTTSFADITGMKVTLQASRSYSFRAEIIATCSSSGGIQVAASSTTTSAIPTIQLDGYAIDGGNLVRGYSQQTTLNSAIIASTVTGTALHAHIYGTVTTTTTGASFKLQVAQQNLSATQTIVLAGSYLLINDTP